jgi:5'-3' exoribonuclease 2
MANMSAAEVLKAELAGLSPVKPAKASTPKELSPTPVPEPELAPMPVEPSPVAAPDSVIAENDPDEVPGFGSRAATSLSQLPPNSDDMKVDLPPDPEEDQTADSTPEVVVGEKRKFEEGPGEEDEEADVTIPDEEDGDAAANTSLALKVNPDGTVEQEDTVKCVVDLDAVYDLIWGHDDRLWEPGYRERYYRQKFGVESEDKEFKKAYVLSSLVPPFNPYSFLGWSRTMWKACAGS